MDPFLLGLILGYSNLSERTGDLWDLMRDKRKQIAWELTHKHREPVLSVMYNSLAPLELEFRDILIEKEKKKGGKR